MIKLEDLQHDPPLLLETGHHLPFVLIPRQKIYCQKYGGTTAT
jgi:hypothetical protein